MSSFNVTGITGISLRLLRGGISVLRETKKKKKQSVCHQGVYTLAEDLLGHTGTEASVVRTM